MQLEALDAQVRMIPNDVVKLVLRKRFLHAVRRLNSAQRSLAQVAHRYFPRVHLMVQRNKRHGVQLFLDALEFRILSQQLERTLRQTTHLDRRPETTYFVTRIERGAKQLNLVKNSIVGIVNKQIKKRQS